MARSIEQRKPDRRSNHAASGLSPTDIDVGKPAENAAAGGEHVDVVARVMIARERRSSATTSLTASGVREWLPALAATVRRQAAATHSRLGRANPGRRASGYDDGRELRGLQPQGATGAWLAPGLRLLAPGLRRRDRVQRLNRESGASRLAAVKSSGLSQQGYQIEEFGQGFQLRKRASARSLPSSRAIVPSARRLDPRTPQEAYPSSLTPTFVFHRADHARCSPLCAAQRGVCDVRHRLEPGRFCAPVYSIASSPRRGRPIRESSRSS